MPDDVKVSVRDLRGRLSDHLRRVQQGESIVITSHDEPVARLVPIKPAQGEPRPFGFMKGQIRIAADFDETPPEVLAAMEADPFPPRRSKRAS
jgi:prevent-host-death family protein